MKKRTPKAMGWLLCLVMVLGLLPAGLVTTARADWIDPDNFAVCQFCGEIYDNSEEGCSSCGLHEPCLEDNADAEEVQLHFQECEGSGDIGWCDECFEMVTSDCECGWHGEGEDGHSFRDDITFDDHMYACLGLEELVCEVCGENGFDSPFEISAGDWCADCGCHLECFDPDVYLYNEEPGEQILNHAVHEGLELCDFCYCLVNPSETCSGCGWHEGDCVPIETHQEQCLGWIYCDSCGECKDPEEVEFCEDCWLCEECWEECPACGAPCNCMCVDDYCEECNTCPNSDPAECDSCGETDHDQFHACEESRCPDCDMCDEAKLSYYGTTECEVENCDNNGNCPCQCGHFGVDLDPDAVDLSTRYDFHVTVTNGQRPLGNVPVYYQYGGKSYFLGFTGPDGVAEGYTTIDAGGAPEGWTVSAGRGGLTKTGGALYKTAGPEPVEYTMRPMEWRDIYDVTADMVMERYTVEGVEDDGTWDLYVIPHLTTDTSYENISWLTQTKLDKQIEKVKNMAENGIGYGGADSNVELHMANNYGVYLYPLDSSGTLSTMEAPWYRSANQLTGQEAPGLIWYIPDVPYGEYLAVVYLPGYKPYVTAYTHYPAQEMTDVRPCELYAYMSTSTSASTTSRMQQVAIDYPYDLINEEAVHFKPDWPLFIHLVNNENGRSTWAVTEPDQPDVFYFKPTSSSVYATYTVNIYGPQDHWYLETTYDGNNMLYPYEAVKYTDDTELDTDLAPGITFYAEGKPLRSGQKVAFTLESADPEQPYAVNITSPQVLGLYDGRLRYNAGKGYTYVADGCGETVYLCNFSNDGYYNSGFGLQGSWKLTASMKGYGDYVTTLTASDMEAMTQNALRINFSTEENGTGVFFSRKLPSTAEPYIIGRDDKSDWTYTVQADGYVQNAANTYQMRLNEWYRSPTETPGAWHNTTIWGLTAIGMDGEYTAELPFSRGGGEYRYQVDFYINRKKVASSNVLSVQATVSLGDCYDMTMKGLDITSYTNATKEYEDDDTLFLLPGQSTTVALKFGERDIKQLVFREEGNFWELYGTPDSFAEVVSSDNYSATIRANEPGAGTLNVYADTLGDERYSGAFSEFYVTVPVTEFKVTMPEPEVGKTVSECQASPAVGCEGWYNVETIWYKGSSITNGTVMASTDTFAGQQEYTVKVVFKEVEAYSDYCFYAQGRNDGAINGEKVQAYGQRDDYYNFLSDEVYLTKTYAGMHDDDGVYVDAVDVNIPVPEAGTTLNDLMGQITISSYYDNVTLKELSVLSPSGVYRSTPLIAQKRYDLVLILEAQDVGEHDSFFTVGGTSIVNGVSDTYFTSQYNTNDGGEPHTTCWVTATIFCGGESDVIPIEALYLVPEKPVLQVGESTKINVYAFPENHTDTIEWSKESYCESYFEWDAETQTLTATGTPRVPSYILYAKTVHGNADVQCIIELTDGSDALYSFTAKDTRVDTNGYYLQDTSNRGSTVCIYPDYTKVPEGYILTGYTITDDDTGAVVDIDVKSSGGVFNDTYYWIYMPARNITATPIYTPTKSGNVSGTVYSNGVLADMIQITLTNASTGNVRKLSLTGENGKEFAFKNVEAGTYTLEVTKKDHKDYLSYLEVNGDQERSITLYQLTPQELVITSVTVSGTVTSYGSETDPVVVQLIESGTSTVAYETTVAGNSASYSISNVSTGTYTLRVTKSGHQIYEQAITVGSSNITCNVTMTQVNAETSGLRLDGDGVWRYYVNGVLQSSYTGLVQHVDGNFYYVASGAIDFTYTGLVDYYGVSYYIQGGILYWGVYGLMYVDGAWCYLYNSTFASNFTGLVQHSDGSRFYVVNGLIDFSYTGLVPDTDGKYYYIISGLVRSDHTGLVQHTDGYFYYVINGVVESSYTGLVPYGELSYYVQGGILYWGVYGLVPTNGAWYYIYNSAAATNYTGLVQHTDGNLYYVEDGTIDWGYTGLVWYADGNWYYVSGGAVDSSYTGLALHSDGYYYYIDDGAVDTSYTGLVDYGGMSFYVQNGVLFWGVNGLVTVGDEMYYLYNSTLASDYSGTVLHTDGKYYQVVNGVAVAVVG